MKLFKSCVTPTALGLLAPMAATTNEVTVKLRTYSGYFTCWWRRAGWRYSHDGSFSETTTAFFS